MQSGSSSTAYPRMTLTAKALLQTRRLILLFFGDRKRATFEEALNGNDVYDKPVRILLNQERVRPGCVLGVITGWYTHEYSSRSQQGDRAHTAA